MGISFKLMLKLVYFYASVSLKEQYLNNIFKKNKLALDDSTLL